jgi:CO/xanthine dehydrogenase Mo-binding subunit
VTPRAVPFDGRWVGVPVPRKEDRRMLLGRGRFVADLTRPGLLHAAFVRSPYAHARVGAIDVTAALQAPGVETVLTAATLGDPYLLALLERDEFVPTRMPILAGDTVRFVGEPVAVVIADDAYRAEDAIELVEVDWDPLPAVASIEPPKPRAPQAARAGRRQLPGRPADVRRRPARRNLRRRRGHRGAPPSQRPGRRPAAGGTRLPGRMGRPRRPAGRARLHPGPAPGPVRVAQALDLPERRSG